ncbi:UDP-N-acetylmuramoyl-L-alanine--D-glutamate ligase [Patescibacteria group bacterium]|nr:UDP-N-acetylmuramoyl-L-alanine--D-glutamate ligase [Patescibacteria group bacterium]MBU1501138.1 UDP-N-acetylmuramoyl-L-alanine--D-glutamate ligase [Patescibacteria group bacterium]MBU2080989.1 UDP-N-acetylmuramoyl-L-alanine--D-glutamate ligase [Patescibacteria group bacterium]MBU2124081.1 UDP-N-acetylmuramoyl-L-alanine--D-glutamate ligase [Patescibacteria group bacterium]MBU2194936.1 UDP-N-acetylmuramoyl-L-alanine--D-glutamate ligase [Patescibacteria group bacterium]
MDARAHFEGKKITVMGLGLLGRGVGDAAYLASQGAELIVTDLKSKEELASSLETLSAYPNITYMLGEHRLEDFSNRDYILKAAGVPDDSPFLTAARAEGIPIKMSASWFAEIAHLPIVGITGTRGKSTVTHMLEAILLKDKREILLGGNVRGVSTLALLEKVTKNQIPLFELDSWQLQGFGEARISPHLSVFTTFYPDHLAYYKNDIDVYLEDKAQIFLNQSEDDVLLLGEQMALTVIEKYAERIKSKVSVVNEELLSKDWELLIPGTHNRYNAALALAAARELGVGDEVSKEALESFLGVPGRLELVALVGGVSFYNDTNSTTPEATITALHALSEETGKHISLIMGGHDKQLDMGNLLELIKELEVSVSLLEGTGTERIKDELSDAELFSSLKEAVTHAHTLAGENGIVLLSPAFSSFGMFANEYDRGDQFNAIVKSL